MRLRQPNGIESARQARRSIKLIRQRLLNPTPQVLESCAPHLRIAIESMERVRQNLADDGSHPSRESVTLRAEIREIASELKQAKALMQHAAAFHSALWSLLAPEGEESISYAAKGIVAVRPTPTMRVEG